MEKRNEAGLTEKEFLEQYTPGNYDRPSVTVDMMLLRTKQDLSGLQILLIKRKNHPYIHTWALPGGFMGITESAYQAACRELKEETNIDVEEHNVYLEQVYTMSRPDRDPRMRIVDVAYAALIPYGTEMKAKAGDDAQDIGWFDIAFTDTCLRLSNDDANITIEYTLSDKIFKNGILNIKGKTLHLVTEDALAFDHSEIILEELMRLRSKVLYTDIAFNLLPEKFTLPDIQKVYEILIGKTLYKTNFRRSIISDKIVELPEKGKAIISNKTITLYKYATALSHADLGNMCEECSQS